MVLELKAPREKVLKIARATLDFEKSIARGAMEMVMMSFP